jgi:ABC-type proline/glycine betaine transport system ATPase subunit
VPGAQQAVVGREIAHHLDRRFLIGDRIFLLERGRVVAEGTYDDLVETNAEFRRLVGGGRG